VIDYLLGLERMVNQIARNFDTRPPEQAAAGVAEHLQKFWDPSMRRDLIDAVASRRIKVSAAVRDAIDDLRMD
jgi:formate dehydrogenase subunit delta